MGRRSINTTKSGKYMNPTDQARKEARKKELKKNKKQRQMVRAAVLKMKDPTQILEELEKIDEMEYNVIQPSPLNEKVLKEKRKKLRETFDRVLKMYDKDEPEKWAELKRQEVEYDKRRNHLVSYYESVKHAQAVHVDEIPLPTLQVPDNLLFGNMPSQIPLPMDILPMMPVRPILKKNTAYKKLSGSLEPPGVPPGPPPDLLELMQAELGTSTPAPKHKTLRFSDQPDEVPGEEQLTEPEPEEEVGEASGNPDEELERDTEEARPSPPPTAPPGLQLQLPPPASASAPPANAPKPTSLQQRMLALSGQNIDEFMKEMEEVHKKREKDRADDLTMRLSALEKERPQVDDDSGSEDDTPTVLNQNPFQGPPGSDDLIRKPPPLMATMFRPPPLRMPGLPPVPLRLPPGPPPGRPSLPPGPPPGLPPRAMLRMPPGPPPGMPPRLMRPPMAPRPILPPVPILTAAPQLINRKDQGATISAKPQIRNLSADVTRFVPSALRVKREDKKAKAGKTSTVDSKERAQPAGPTKDDAYMQFMREMQGLL